MDRPNTLRTHGRVLLKDGAATVMSNAGVGLHLTAGPAYIIYDIDPAAARGLAALLKIAADAADPPKEITP